MRVLIALLFGLFVLAAPVPAQAVDLGQFRADFRRALDEADAAFWSRYDFYGRWADLEDRWLATSGDERAAIEAQIAEFRYVEIDSMRHDVAQVERTQAEELHRLCRDYLRAEIEYRRSAPVSAQIALTYPPGHDEIMQRCDEIDREVFRQRLEEAARIHRQQNRDRFERLRQAGEPILNHPEFAE